MSIISNSYEACKVVKTTPFRAEMKELIRGWMRSDSPFSMLEYMSRGVGKQFLSFLFVNHNRDRLGKAPFPVSFPELQPQHLKLIQEAHFCLQRINQLCLRDVISLLPTLEQVLDPYADRRFESIKTEGFVLPLDLDTFKNVASAFSNHYASAILRRRLIEFPNLTKISSEHYILATHKIRQAIGDAGLFNVPKDISELHRMLDPKSPQYALSNIAMALVALHDSIENLDQLLYQTFIEDKLIALDNDNVIEIDKAIRNYIGESMQLLVQPMGREMLSRPGELVIVDIKDGSFVKHGLFKIFSKSDRILGKYGSTSTFDLRGLNDDLSCFFHNLN